MSNALKDAKEVLDASKRAMETIHAREQAEKKVEEDSPETLAQKVRDMAIGTRRIVKIYDAAMDFYEKVKPWVGPVLKPIGWTARGLKNAFVFAAYERENGERKLDEDGDPVFSPKRLMKSFVAAGMIGASAAAGVQAAYFYGTQFSELVYVTGKEQIVPGEKYQFTGCTSLPCSTANDNGKYYQIEKGLVFPTLIYPEEDVFANIPAQNAACHVEGYGIYFKSLKWLFKRAEWYQNVYDVSCRPLTQNEINKTIDTGQVSNPTLNME